MSDKVIQIFLWNLKYQHDEFLVSNEDTFFGNKPQQEPISSQMNTMWLTSIKIVVKNVHNKVNFCNQQ